MFVDVEDATFDAGYTARAADFFQGRSGGLRLLGPRGGTVRTAPAADAVGADLGTRSGIGKETEESTRRLLSFTNKSSGSESERVVRKTGEELRGTLDASETPPFEAGTRAEAESDAGTDELQEGERGMGRPVGNGLLAKVPPVLGEEKEKEARDIPPPFLRSTPSRSPSTSLPPPRPLTSSTGSGFSPL